MSIADNVQSVMQRIQIAAASPEHHVINEVRHDAESEISGVTLLAVSKKRSHQEIEEAYQAGLRHFGENYLQEAEGKIKQLSDLPIEWHYIGPIQSNKTRLISEHFSWVHCVDRQKIAQRLSDQRPGNLPPLNICLQVNIDNEPTKAGVHIEELPQLTEKVVGLPGIQLRGLMCIPAVRKEISDQQEVFAKMRQLLLDLKSKHPQIDSLSMGMSADLEAAVIEGASIVRIGTALFGPRE